MVSNGEEKTQNQQKRIKTRKRKKKDDSKEKHIKMNLDDSAQ